MAACLGFRVRGDRGRVRVKGQGWGEGSLMAACLATAALAAAAAARAGSTLRSATVGSAHLHWALWKERPPAASKLDWHHASVTVSPSATQNEVIYVVGGP